MNVLIVEDVEFRQNLIRDTLGFEHTECTKDADQALLLLKEKAFDLVFLDHDLIGARSGSYLTQHWFNNRGALQTVKPVVIIHSMNMAGATKMENHLQGISRVTARIPFRQIVLGEVDLKARVRELLDG
jgi:CheY-like chemotaxis protein